MQQSHSSRALLLSLRRKVMESPRAIKLWNRRGKFRLNASFDVVERLPGEPMCIFWYLGSWLPVCSYGVPQLHELLNRVFFRFEIVPLVSPAYVVEMAFYPNLLKVLRDELGDSSFSYTQTEPLPCQVFENSDSCCDRGHPVSPMESSSVCVPFNDPLASIVDSGKYL